MARSRDVLTFTFGTALAALLLAASACWWHGRPAGPAARDTSDGEIALQVTNHNYLDVVVYVVHDGQRTRVGTVSGSSSAVFSLPVRLLGAGREIHLLGDPIGSRESARTETLTVQPGQYIEWTLETDLRQSSVAVH